MIAGQIDIVLAAGIARLQADMDRARQVVGDATSAMSRMAGAARTALGALAGVLSVAAFATWVKGAIDAVDAIGDISPATGVAIKDIAALQLAFQFGGLEAGEFEKTMIKLSSKIADNDDTLVRLGISTRTATGELRASKDVLYDVADLFSKAATGTNKTAVATELFGKTGAALIPVLDMGADGLREMAEMADKLGLSFTDAGVEAAGQFNDSLDTLGLATQGIARQVAVQLLPHLNDLVGSFATLITESGGVRKAADAIGVGFKAIYTGGLALYQVFDTLSSIIAISISAVLDGFGTVGKSLKYFIEGEYGKAWEAAVSGSRGAVSNIKKLGTDMVGSWSTSATAIAGVWDGTSGKVVEDFAAMQRAGKLAAAATKEQEAASKKAAAEAEKVEKAQASFIAGLEKEVAHLGMSAAEIKISEAATLGLTGAKLEHVGAMVRSIEAYKSDAAWALESASANADNLESLAQMTAQLRAEALAQQDANDRIGLSATAIAELDAQRLESLATIKDENASIAEAIDWTGAMSEAYRAQAEALRDRAAATREGAAKGQDVDLTRARELLDVMTQVDEATQSAAESMTQSFGRVGTAIGGLTTALSGYARNQAAIAAQLAAVKSDKNSSPELIARAEIAAAKQSAQARVKSYGDMAGAAKSFFKENTAGYKVMEGTEKAFRAAEMAMAVEAMVKKIFFKEGEVAANMTLNATKLAGEATTTAASTGLAATEASAWGITAVVKALASLPFPANLAAGAATLAAVVAIGAKLVGGGSMNAGGMTAAEMQKRQGTGTVFGDSDAKSESILKSLEMLEGHSDALIPINQGMLSALRNIESAMTGVTNILLRTPGVINGTNMGIDEGKVKSSMGVGTAAILSGVFAPITMALAKLWGSTKTAVVDSGIQFGGSIRDLQNGVGYQQYASVDTTKKSWFGLSKKTTNSIQTAGIDGELADQIGLIFSGVDRALTEAARSMGMGADQVGAALDAMVIATTKVSLKDLKGEDLTAALNAVISKTMDDMAMAVFPAFDKFRQVGEGYAETVVRAASNYARLDAALSSIGMTFGAVGLDSLSARQSIIDLSGGMDKFAEQADSFAQDFLTEAQRLAPVQKYVTEQMAALGYASVTTRQGFADIVLGLKLADPEQAKMYASLMALKDAFAAVTPAIDETTRSAKDIAEERAAIDRKIFDLTHTAAEILARDRADELAALDATNRAQMLRYYALMDEAEATAKAAEAAIEANAALEKARATAKQAVDAAKQVVDAARADVQTAYNAEAGALQSAITAHQNYAKSIRQFKDSLLMGANSILSPEARYAEARRQLGEATPENFVAASNAFLEASKAYNGSTEAYARDFELAQRMADQAVAAADSAAMFASAQLSALNQQVQGILEVNKSVQSVREALLAYKAVGGTAGVGAMAGFTPGVPYTGGAMSMLQADGTFLNAIGPGFGRMYTDAEFAAIQAGKFDGSHAGGLDYVPFDGYRAELHKGERVQTAAAARASDASAVETTKLLREVLGELRAANGQRGAVGTAQITVQERAEKRLASLERKLARAE